MRVFFGIKTQTTAAIESMLRELAELGPAVRPIDIENLHLTLKFIGEATAEQIEGLNSSLHECVSRHAPFETSFAGLDAFPKQTRATVVWAGVTNPEPIEQMAAGLETAAESLGFPREGRAYNPHLTLARVKAKPPSQLQSLFAAHADTVFATQFITTVTLYQSQRTPGGVVYSPLTTLPLRGENNA